jgi:hypothetical protein
MPSRERGDSGPCGFAIPFTFDVARPGFHGVCDQLSAKSLRSPNSTADARQFFCRRFHPQFLRTCRRSANVTVMLFCHIWKLGSWMIETERTSFSRLSLRRLVTLLYLFCSVVAVPAATLASDCYLQKLTPRMMPTISRPALCGGRVGRPQQTVIMADKPRQAAMIARQNPRLGVPMADRAYSNAAAAETNYSPTCVDLYFEAVAFSWNFIQSPGSPDQPEYPEAWQIYHQALQRLLETSQKYGRLDLQDGLRVNTAVGPVKIPVNRHGFLWQAGDFNRLVVVTDELTGNLTNHYYHAGLGVPLVVVRDRVQDEKYLLKSTPFAATAVLRPSLAVLSGHAPPIGAESSHGPLELYDPLRVSSVAVNGQHVKMATDTSAPLELATASRDYKPISGLLRPEDTSTEEKLFMIEPYQRGKYPVVLVHGLMSSSQVWANVANEILARPEFREKFQLWAFQYPTGLPFLESAAELRQRLIAARNEFDPTTDDPALSHMVIIGHSMGGLVAKLQVTSSDDRLWCSIARKPLSEIKATDEQRDRLRSLFYFEPLPFVSRVVFAGTPHHGSRLARTSIGRLGSCLVQQPWQNIREHQILVHNNPGVFAPELAREIPSSLDMLDPKSRLLHAIDQLCPSGYVQFHSIIGTGCPSVLEGPADGVVAANSAMHACSSSARFVHTTHGKLHSDARCLSEILCILRRHIWESEEGACDESPARELYRSEVRRETVPDTDPLKLPREDFPINVPALEGPVGDTPPSDDLPSDDLPSDDLPSDDLPSDDLPSDRVEFEDGPELLPALNAG